MRLSTWKSYRTIYSSIEYYMSTLNKKKNLGFKLGFQIENSTSVQYHGWGWNPRIHISTYKKKSIHLLPVERQFKLYYQSRTILSGWQMFRCGYKICSVSPIASTFLYHFHRCINQRRTPKWTLNQTRTGAKMTPDCAGVKRAHEPCYYKFDKHRTLRIVINSDAVYYLRHDFI